MKKNIFAEIIAGTIPCNEVYETDTVLAFYDIAPKAKTHILIIPKEEIVTAKEVTEENLTKFGELFLAAKKIAKKLNMDGYKLHMNVGENGGQIVPHVHLHFLSPDYKSPL
jgi:histidine triad (HIT) family protein